MYIIILPSLFETFSDRSVHIQKELCDLDTNAIVREVEKTYEKVKSLAGWTVDKNVVLTITLTMSRLSANSMPKI